MQPLGDIRNQSCGQSKTMDLGMEGRTDKLAQPSGQLRPACQENASYKEQKKVEFSEVSPYFVSIYPLTQTFFISLRFFLRLFD